MSMRAKINFYASKVGEHPNILHFMGAVLDDETRKFFSQIIHLLYYCKNKSAWYYKMSYLTFIVKTNNV